MTDLPFSRGGAAGLRAPAPRQLRSSAADGARSQRRLPRRLRRSLLALLASTSLGAAAAQAQDATWEFAPTVAGPTPGTFDFNANANWTPAIVPTGTAFFGTSNGPNISFSAVTAVDGWTFTAGASAYSFTNGQILSFNGAGIVINGGSAAVTNNNVLQFNVASTAGTAAIVNNASLAFNNTATAGDASITTNNGGTTSFFGNSTGGNAQFITNAGGTVDFSATTGPDGNGLVSAGSIAGAGNYVLGGNQLTVGGDNSSTTVGGVISGVGGALVKTGTGTLALTGANTFSGGVFLNSGTISAGNNGALGTGTLTALGGTLDIRHTVVISNSTDLVAGLAINVDGGATGEHAGNILSGGDPAGLTKIGSGTLVLSGNNTYSGATAVEAGVLVAAADTALPTLSAVTVNAGATLSVADGIFAGAGSLGDGSGGGGAVVIGLVDPSTSLTVGFDGTSTTFSGTITGAGSFELAGTGSLTLTGAGSTIGGNLTVCTCAAGMLNIGGGSFTVGNLTSVFSGTLAVSNGGTLNSQGGAMVSGLGITPNAVVTGAGSTWNVDNGLAIGAFGGVGSLTIADGGVVNSTAVTTIDAGSTLNLGMGGLAGSIVTPQIVNDGQIVANFTDALTLSAQIDGSGSLTKSGSGTLVLTGTNTYSGGTTLAGGTVSVAQEANLGDVAGALTFDGGILQITGTSFTATARSINWGAGGGGFDIVDAGNTFTVSQNLTGGGPLAKLGLGTLVLSGTNTYAGGTVISAGTLEATNNSSVGSGTVTLDGGTFRAGADALTFANGFAINTTGGTIATNLNTLTIAGNIVNGNGTTGALNVIGGGTLILTGINSYSGGTIINSADLQLGDATHTAKLVGNVVVNDGTFTIANADTSAIASIANNAFGSTHFLNATSAGNAVIFNNQNGFTRFFDSSSAANATIVNDGVLVSATDFGGTLSFRNASTAANATIFNRNNGFTGFNDASTAANATIFNSNNGALDRSGQFLSGGTYFFDTSSAGAATIVNSSGGIAYFGNTSTAANATIVNLDGGITYFFDASTGGQARLVAAAGGTVDISGLTSSGMTAGSIEGAGSYLLGAKGLTVGGNNLSTEVSGVIADGGIEGGTGGSLVKAGTGFLVLSGVNTYTGTTTVNGGALIVNGSIAASGGLTVDPGAVVGGSGVLPGTTINGGTLSPGSSIGTITISGNLSFVGPGTYLVEVAPLGADRTNVSGTATLDGTLRIVPLGGTYFVGARYVLLNATQGLTGTFDTVDFVSGFGPGIRPRVSYDSNDLLLFLDPSAISPFLPSGLTGNQRNVAAALDAGFAALAAPEAYLSLFRLSAAGLTHALDQLSGEIGTGAAAASFRSMDQFLTLMLDPFLDNRVNGSSGSVTAPALAFAPEDERGAETISSYARMPTKARPMVPFERRWSVWGAGYGGQGSFDGDPVAIGSHKLTVSNGGVAGGVDYRLAPNSVLGAALTGSSLSYHLAGGLGSGKGDAVQAGLYGSTRLDKAYVSAAVSLGWYDLSTDRTVLLPGITDHLVADFSARSVGGRLESGYRMPVLASSGVTPYGAVQALSLRTPSYAETDATNLAAFALNYAANTSDELRSELGLRFDTRLALMADSILILRGRAAWTHAFAADRSISAVLQTLPVAGFTVFGAAPAENAALVSTGAELRLGSGISALAKFDGEFAGGSQVYAGSGTVRFSW